MGLGFQNDSLLIICIISPHCLQVLAQNVPVRRHLDLALHALVPADDLQLVSVIRLHGEISGRVPPRQGTEICNFGAPSPVDFFEISPVDFFPFSPGFCAI